MLLLPLPASKLLDLVELLLSGVSDLVKKVHAPTTEYSHLHLSHAQWLLMHRTGTVQMNLPYEIPTHVDLYSAAILRDFIHRIPYKKTRTLFLHSR